jgi:hypothetical protein
MKVDNGNFRSVEHRQSVTQTFRVKAKGVRVKEPRARPLIFGDFFFQRLLSLLDAATTLRNEVRNDVLNHLSTTFNVFIH